MFTTSYLANEVYPDRQGGKVEESINQSSAFNNNDDDSLFPSKHKKLKDQKRPFLNQTGMNHSNKTSLNYANSEEIKEKASPRSFKFSPCKNSSIGKLLALSSIKGALNRPKNLRHIKMLNELNLSVPGANEPVLFESKVSKWNSSTNKKFSNDYLVLTRQCLFHFKSPEKSAKVFDGIPLCTLPPKGNDNLLDSSSGFPAEHVILTLATVFSITEYLTPEPTIRLDYVSSHKKQSFITITAPDLQKHRQWLISLRSTVRNSNPIGPYLTSQQRTWLTQKLISMDDLDDLTEENEENLKSYCVLLKSFTDEKNSDRNCEKERCLPVSLVFGKNNLYFVPINFINADEKYRMNKELLINNSIFIEEIKSKEVDIKKYKYPLLSLTKIRSDRHDDTFQLTFMNNKTLTKKTLTLSSLLFEIIINEIKSVIDSIIYWYPNPSYQMQILSSPTSFPSLLSPLFSPILQPSASSSTLNNLNNFNGRGKTQMIGLERMIEAQCHAFRTSKARISFNVEYVIGTESVILGLDVEHLPFRFTLLPPNDNLNKYNYLDEEEDTYTKSELLAIINSLKYHPLLYEVIFRNINLSKLQIESSATGKKVLPLEIYELLVTNPKLRKLDLTFCGITGETVSAIGDALFTGKSSLERLIISNNCITREGAQSLAKGISTHGLAIKELDISNCELTHDSLVFILKALNTNNIEELESLNLSNISCELDLSILSDLLSKTVNLRALSLRNCNKLITGLKKSIQFEDLNLTTLDVGGIPLNSKEQLRSLYSYIQSTSFAKIKYFSVDHCNLDGKVLAIILSCISSSPNYEKIRVWAGGNHITRTSIGCREFCDAVRNDWTPVWLSLDNTIFGSNPELVENILSSFCENSVLEFLDLSHPQFNDDENNYDNNDNINNINNINNNNSINNIDINNNNKISSNQNLTARKACEMIGKLFRENKSIKELILLGDAEQRWGQSLGIQLLELENNNVLERLNIKGNGISNVGAKCISEALKSNTTLKLLNMDENEIGIEGYTSIYNVISAHENTTLQDLVYPIHDMQIYIESLDVKLSNPISRDSLFSSQSIKSNHRISIEKQKIEFKNIVGKIMLEIEEHLKNNEINTKNIETTDEISAMNDEDNEEIEVGH